MEKRDLELLQAIQQMIDPMKDDIKDMKDDIKDIKVRLTNVEEDLAEVKVRLTNVEEDLAEVKEDLAEVKEDLAEVKEESRRTAIIVENIIEPKLQLLCEGYSDHVKKMRNIPAEVDELKEDVSILKFTQRQMADIIKEKLGV